MSECTTAPVLTVFAHRSPSVVICNKSKNIVFFFPCFRVSLSDTSRCETSPQEQLQSLLPKPCPLSQVDVSADRALLAGLELVRRNDFDPTHSLEVRYELFPGP